MSLLFCLFCLFAFSFIFLFFFINFGPSFLAVVCATNARVYYQSAPSYGRNIRCDHSSVRRRQQHRRDRCGGFSLSLSLYLSITQSFAHTLTHTHTHTPTPTTHLTHRHFRTQIPRRAQLHARQRRRTVTHAARDAVQARTWRLCVGA